jgi:hypothetical protein
MSRNPFAGTDDLLLENLIPTGRKPRSRTWDKRNPGYQYYLRDTETGRRISDIAYHYETPLHEIATAFVQIALDRADQIPWASFPAHGNATLERGRGGRWEVRADGWPPEKIP